MSLKTTFVATAESSSREQIDVTHQCKCEQDDK